MITVESCDPFVSALDLAVISEIAAAAGADVARLLPALPSEIVLDVRTRRNARPDIGGVGVSMAPGRIEWSVDPDRPGGTIGVAQRELRATLFHELHHQARGWTCPVGPQSQRSSKRRSAKA